MRFHASTEAVLGRFPLKKESPWPTASAPRGAPPLKLHAPSRTDGYQKSKSSTYCSLPWPNSLRNRSFRTQHLNGNRERKHTGIGGAKIQFSSRWRSCSVPGGCSRRGGHTGSHLRSCSRRGCPRSHPGPGPGRGCCRLCRDPACWAVGARRCAWGRPSRNLGCAAGGVKERIVNMRMAPASHGPGWGTRRDFCSLIP